MRLLMMMRSDKEWICSWRSPRRIAAALDREIADVVQRMHACRACRSGGKESEFCKATAVVDSMEPWPVPRQGTRSKSSGQRKPRVTRARVSKRRAARGAA